MDWSWMHFLSLQALYVLWTAGIMTIDDLWESKTGVRNRSLTDGTVRSDFFSKFKFSIRKCGGWHLPSYCSYQAQLALELKQTEFLIAETEGWLSNSYITGARDIWDLFDRSLRTLSGPSAHDIIILYPDADKVVFTHHVSTYY